MDRRVAPALAAVWAAALGWQSYVRGRQIPLLDGVDLGFHELGHMLMYPWPFPRLVDAVMGSVTQVAVPLGLAAYFWWVRHELPAAAALTAWAGTSARDVSIYIADAPYEELPLIGGYHDWAFILDANMALAQPLANVVKAAGALMILGAIAVCAWQIHQQTDTEPSSGPTVGPWPRI